MLTFVKHGFIHMAICEFGRYIIKPNVGEGAYDLTLHCNDDVQDLGEYSSFDRAVIKAEQSLLFKLAIYNTGKE